MLLIFYFLFKDLYDEARSQNEKSHKDFIEKEMKRRADLKEEARQRQLAKEERRRKKIEEKRKREEAERKARIKGILISNKPNFIKPLKF